MNLSNKYISAEDIESVEQLERIFEAAQRHGIVVTDSFKDGCVRIFQKRCLGYIRADQGYMIMSTALRYLPCGCTRIKPADILEPDYYDGEWHAWYGSWECPIADGTKAEIHFRDGEIAQTNTPESLRWSHLFFGNSLGTGDIIRFRVLDSTKKSHPRAPLLREIAQEAEVNPEFWKAFRVRNRLAAHHTWHGEWFTTDGEHLYRYALNDDYDIERKPRTIHLSGDVPKDVIDRAKEIAAEVDRCGLNEDDTSRLAKALLDLRTGADE